MNGQQQAIGILAEAETSLRKLIERALAENRYRDIAGIAEIVEELSDLIEAYDAVEGDDDSSGDVSVAASGLEMVAKSRTRESLNRKTATTSQASSTKRKSARPRRNYPYFEREKDKLIKVGWSKKDGRVYEHRTPRSVVFLFSERVGSRALGSEVFAMDDLLPVTDEQGKEVPSYQAYLALAWLRSVGAIERRGKEGYVVADGALENRNVERLWDLVLPRE